MSATVSHVELQKWPLWTGVFCTKHQKLPFPIFTGGIKTGLC